MYETYVCLHDCVECSRGILRLSLSFVKLLSLCIESFCHPLYMFLRLTFFIHPLASVLSIPPSDCSLAWESDVLLLSQAALEFLSLFLHCPWPNQQGTIGRQRTYTNTMALSNRKIGMIHNMDCCTACQWSLSNRLKGSFCKRSQPRQTKLRQQTQELTPNIQQNA